MDCQDLRKLLEETDNRFSVFASRQILNQYDLNVTEFIDLINDFLSDAEKANLLSMPHFQQLGPNIKVGIIKLISDEGILLQTLNEDGAMVGIPSYYIIDIIKNMSDASKTQLLYNQEFIKKYEIAAYEIMKIIKSLSDSEKAQILTNDDLIKNKLQLADWQIINLAKELSGEDSKRDILKKYHFEKYLMVELITTFSDKSKLEILLEDKNFDRNDKINILKSLNVDALSEFIKNNKEFCEKNNIRPYQIVRLLKPEQQLSFVADLENMGLSLIEKREVLVVLKPETKQNVDSTNFPIEYKTALSMQTTEIGNIIIDLERKLEDYQGLDNLINVNPEKFTNDQRMKFMQLCDICPNLRITNILDKNVEFTSTSKEYKEAEEWISSLIGSLNPEYSDAQKIAVIDNAIGKKISYSPTFDTEVFDVTGNRALWKIISSGYGVCNGIANVEKYILDKIGIESEIVSSGTHSFLKIKNIELPLANGETVKGNTILDPTWNLSNHRFGGRPNNFCISYEEARKNDIDANGKDHFCHKNDSSLEDTTISLDEQSLRNLFMSVGLADKEGNFPIKDLLDKSESIHQRYVNQPDVNIRQQFLLLSQVCPEFANCQNSSMSILSNVLLNNENFKFNKCVVNRVYKKEDSNKEPILYVYINSNELGEKFYYADENKGQFIELPQEEFTKQFECYEGDLEKTNGIRPWETIEEQKQEIDLSKSSGKIVAKEGEER